MAAYIDEAYVIARLGQALTTRLWSATGELTASIEDASEAVKSASRSHARDGSVVLGETSDDSTVKRATYYMLLTTTASRPGQSFELSEDFAASSYGEAYKMIRAGNLQASEEIDPTVADSNSWSDVETYPQRTARDQLEGL